MLHRRDRATGASTDTSDRDTDAHSQELDGEPGDDADAQLGADTEAEVYDEGDWDEDDAEGGSQEGEEEGDWDEDDAEGDWDEEDAEGDWDETDEEDEEVVPPTASTALRRSWLNTRSRAQPATGTEEDGRKVNFIDKRERLIGYFLGVMLVALAVVSYVVDRHYVDKQNLKLQSQIHSEAPWILLITLGLGAAILLATYFKRRAAVGFALLLSGVALFNSDFLIGIIYLGAGLWLVFRSMKKTPRAAAGARNGTRSRTSPSARTATPRSSQASSTSKPASARTIGRNGRLAGSASSTGRYTPPKPVRHAPPVVQREAEPTNRLSAWLKK